MTDFRKMNPWAHRIPTSAALPTRIGLLLLVLWFGGFGAWATLAPLDGAVVASGAFVATGQNKLVQHLEGGIVRDLLVREGEHVKHGQIVARIDDTAAQSKLRRLVLKKYRLVIMQARLEAEMSGAGAFGMPSVLMEVSTDPEVASIFNRQANELKARQATLSAQEVVIEKEIAGLKEGLSGYDAQVKSNEQRAALFSEELKDKNMLLQRHLSRKMEVLALQRAEAGLVGDLGELMGRIADSRERIARAEQRITHLRSESVQRSAQELRETETQLDDVHGEIQAVQDIVNRVEVRAPVTGVVVKLNFHTTGGVVAPGATILELLPSEDDLQIEARLKPTDISYVKEGQPALARLTALNQRTTPMVAAKVSYLSADALDSQPSTAATGNSAQHSDFYVVRIQLQDDDLHARVHGFRPTPGMPADVYIKTGERTFLQYIMRPVLDTFARSFREH